MFALIVEYIFLQFGYLIRVNCFNRVVFPVCLAPITIIALPVKSFSLIIVYSFLGIIISANIIENITLFFRFQSQIYILYYKENSECDFVVFDRDRPMYCIQVCYDISEPETHKG
jgi:hypothetical protein